MTINHSDLALSVFDTLNGLPRFKAITVNVWLGDVIVSQLTGQLWWDEWNGKFHERAGVSLLVLADDLSTVGIKYSEKQNINIQIPILSVTEMTEVTENGFRTITLTVSKTVKFEVYYKV